VINEVVGLQFHEISRAVLPAFPLQTDLEAPVRNIIRMKNVKGLKPHTIDIGAYDIVCV